MPAADAAGRSSFYEELLAETVGPFTSTVGELEVTIEPPTADDVCDLDECTGLVDSIEVLCPDDADDLLDEFDDLPGNELTEFVDELRCHFALLRPPPGGFTTIVEQLELYGPAIEFDLLTLGVDLADWFRHHDRYPWAKLQRILERLPRGGHYWAAITDDDELAEMRIRYREQAKADGVQLPPARPPLVGWTSEVELLQALLDAMRSQQHLTVATSPKVKGKGGKAPQPLPRPETAEDRIKRTHLLVEHDEIASMLLGDRYTPRFAPSAREPAPEVIRGGVLLDPN